MPDFAWVRLVSAGEPGISRTLRALEDVLELLQVSGMEVREPEMCRRDTALNIFDGSMASREQALYLAGRALQDDGFWCRLESSRVRLHFGYDHIVYVGSNRVDEVLRIGQAADQEVCVHDESPWEPEEPVGSYATLTPSTAADIERLSAQDVSLIMCMNSRDGQVDYYQSTVEFFEQTLGSFPPRSVITLVRAREIDLGANGIVTGSEVGQVVYRDPFCLGPGPLTVLNYVGDGLTMVAYPARVWLVDDEFSEDSDNLHFVVPDRDGISRSRLHF